MVDGTDEPIEGKLTPAALSRRLAARITALGGNPFASENEQYAVLIGDESGEIIELGRPLRGNRIFPKKALTRNIQLLRDLEQFASEHDVANWKYWSVKTPRRKVDPERLKEGLADFNRRLNCTLTVLRKRHNVKLILLTIHMRFDHWSGLFDLHAHMICDVPPESMEAAQMRLFVDFSKEHCPDELVRNVAAAATYCLWRVYEADEMLRWPDSALRAVWALHTGRGRPHLVRTGQAFQNWRKARSASVKKDTQRIDELRRKRANRRATRDARPGPRTGDRVLAERPIRVRGKKEKILALIVERRSAAPSGANTESSASWSTSQTRPSASQASATESMLKAVSEEIVAPIEVSVPPETDVDESRGAGRRAAQEFGMIPWRYRWWMKAWPPPIPVRAHQFGPIRRRLARLQARSRAPSAG